jgi:hypothetical protein
MNPSIPALSRQVRHEAIQSDCIRRWEKRAGQRRDPALWEGDPPLHEAYDEICDLINYLEEERRRGGDVWQLLALAWPLALWLHERLHP